MIDDSFLRGVIDRIVANYAPEQILLFGSQAKNVATDASDVDLLIIRDTLSPMGRRGKNVQALFSNSPVKLDLLFYTWKEIQEERTQPFSFVSLVLPSARVLYSRSSGATGMGN